MPTDTTEKGLESLIMRHMTGVDGLFSGPVDAVAETAPHSGGSGWRAGHPAAYDRDFAVDGTGPEKGADFGREAGTRRRLEDYGGRVWPSSARGCLNAE